MPGLEVRPGGTLSLGSWSILVVVGRVEKEVARNERRLKSAGGRDRRAVGGRRGREFVDSTLIRGNGGSVRRGDSPCVGGEGFLRGIEKVVVCCMVNAGMGTPVPNFQRAFSRGPGEDEGDTRGNHPPLGEKAKNETVS